jgi:cell division protein FtsI/penicillin-binding protein 2
MIQARHRWQASLVAVLLLAGFGGIGWRLVDLQVLKHDWLKAQAHKERGRAYVVEGRRGCIRDAGGNMLASSIAKKLVVADARLLSSLDLPAPVAPAIVRKTAEILKMDERAVWAKLNRDTHYVVIAHKVDGAVFQRLTNEICRMDFGLTETALPRKQKTKLAEARRNAIYADPRDEFDREYPNGPLAAHVLGYVNAEHRGVDGIELQFDSKLHGYDGEVVTDIDAQRRPLPQYERINILPHDGLDVHLTINQSIQGVLEAELDKAMSNRRPDSVVGIVMRPRTGEIVAMAVRPGFDPAQPSKALAGYRNSAEALSALRNRCITDVAEPGSTFKIVTVAGALNERAVTLHDLFGCNSPFVFYGVPLHDHHNYGTLNVERIITKSSNIGAAKIGMRLGAKRLYDYMKAFGFGEKTGVELPGEVRGIVRKPTGWSKISIAHIPMGHEVAVTPLQMCSAMCAIANEGRLMKPMIVSALVSREGKLTERFHPKLVRQVIAPETAAQMVETLTTVTRPGGTGVEAAIAPYDIAGKTGTAQKLQDGRYVQKYYSSFVGFFPAKRPELCILISMDNPNDPDGAYYGGKVAAPVFREVAMKAAKLLSIPPDHPEREIAGQTAAGPGRLLAGNHATQQTH